MMKRTLWKILPGPVLAGIMLVSAVAWSDGHPRGTDGHPAPMLSRMAEHLQLDESQQEQIGALLQSAREEGEADHSRKLELHDALREMQTDFDADEARALSSELGEISARGAYRMAETRSGIYALLTAEQRAQLGDMMAQREERREERRGSRY